MNDQIASLICIVVGAFLAAPALVLSSWWIGLASLVFTSFAVYFDYRAFPKDHE